MLISGVLLLFLFSFLVEFDDTNAYWAHFRMKNIFIFSRNFSWYNANFSWCNANYAKIRVISRNSRMITQNFRVITRKINTMSSIGFRSMTLCWVVDIEAGLIESVTYVWPRSIYLSRGWSVVTNPSRGFSRDWDVTTERQITVHPFWLAKSRNSAGVNFCTRCLQTTTITWHLHAPVRCYGQTGKVPLYKVKCRVLTEQQKK